MTMRDLIPWGRQGSNVPGSYDEGKPLVSLHREMNRLFDDVLRGFGDTGWGRELTWPNVEIGDSEREVRIAAEVPGMSEKDVELLVEDGVLTLRGEKKSETEDKDRGYSERRYGRFERRIGLPRGVEVNAASATFRDGVLTVTLPKTPEADTGRRIPINPETKH